jgi:hypothetical protein
VAAETYRCLREPDANPELMLARVAAEAERHERAAQAAREAALLGRAPAGPGGAHG